MLAIIAGFEGSGRVLRKIMLHEVGCRPYVLLLLVSSGTSLGGCRARDIRNWLVRYDAACDSVCSSSHGQSRSILLPLFGEFCCFFAWNSKALGEKAGGDAATEAGPEARHALANASTDSGKTLACWSAKDAFLSIWERLWL